MVKKQGLAKEIFQNNANMQGGKRVPLKPVREYGTGMPVKKGKKK